MARINVVLKRNNQNVEESVKKSFKFKDLEINMSGRCVYVEGKKVDLTPKEYDLLVYLIKNKNVALSREKILLEVWGYDFYGFDRTIDTHIKMLRNSIGKYRYIISTIRGVGYKLEL